MYISPPCHVANHILFILHGCFGALLIHPQNLIKRQCDWPIGSCNDQSRHAACTVTCPQYLEIIIPDALKACTRNIINYFSPCIRVGWQRMNEWGLHRFLIIFIASKALIRRLHGIYIRGHNSTCTCTYFSITIILWLDNSLEFEESNRWTIASQLQSVPWHSAYTIWNPVSRFESNMHPTIYWLGRITISKRESPVVHVHVHERTSIGHSIFLWFMHYSRTALPWPDILVPFYTVQSIPHWLLSMGIFLASMQEISILPSVLFICDRGGSYLAGRWWCHCQ